MHDLVHFIEICTDFEYSQSCILLKGLVIWRKKILKAVFIGLRSQGSFIRLHRNSASKAEHCPHLDGGEPMKKLMNWIISLTLNGEVTSYQETENLYVCI